MTEYLFGLGGRNIVVFAMGEGKREGDHSEKNKHPHVGPSANLRYSVLSASSPAA